MNAIVPSAVLPAIAPLDRALEPMLRAKVDGKAKPLGALGRIEELAVHLGLIAGSPTPTLGRSALVVAAGDHGIVAEGVSAHPSEVSALIAEMVLAGKAGASIAARAAGADVFVVDAGLKRPLAPHPGLIERRLGPGTRNFRREDAMSAGELDAALTSGVELARDLKAKGYGVLALGEIGIGNSSSAALIAHAVTSVALPRLVGPGAGVPPRGLAHKRAVLEKAYTRAPVRGGCDALQAFGGFEIAMLCGLMIGGASERLALVVDGFIVTAAALAAASMAPFCRDYLIFAHASAEAGHAFMLEWLGAGPLLDLGLRLGEGTGAALALPLVKMAALLLNDMADLPQA